ncbi:hypothetical protein IFM58399_08169 [Aspergillus lentulus]|uniref:Uncharacterized protein n=1 Tax=Aspergillus lentulus TaxID=293939 RepID=A0AAN5YLN2_ASPLE|nr:uncharacterized protein IFM58399_08169 [Aspergillus lentulus]KAF4153524.1 hypothetical protein CNMCM6069_000668 [Aspergillus lentulus]KAF4163763.1 hypothetical protein CNMCM6936_000295 [Aspergillus lentulus]KAF4173043.1 hypothetical protein CNMCM8060_000652 [Aspergillus lentulus]KAF4182267.1 hypothetical protein CNMCM7927_000170 [Aspergillus lentulus]KAF4193897.1 hypothetical protein CNMCM8694_008316 [Aspergillus lentulus]
MPHKHKRRKNDSSIYDLPPTLIAKPLPTHDPNAPKSKGKKPPLKSKAPKKKENLSAFARSKSDLDDDTPRAFRRLMQLQANGGKSAPSKPDAGETGSKKRKRDASEDTKKSARKKSAASSTPIEAANDATSTTAAAEPKPTNLKILPGEKLSDFAARVDREMPISGMKRSGKPTSADLPKLREGRQTKHEKHLRRLQEQWRKEEAEIKEREAAEREEREAELEEQLELWKEWEMEAAQAKAKKKGAAAKRKKKGDGALEDDGPDPWAKLKKRDRMNKPANPFDVVQAPPQLTKPKEVFKVRGGARVDVANVPAAVGSLRRREELASERRTIVEEYRRLMAEKRR